MANRLQPRENGKFDMPKYSHGIVLALALIVMLGPLGIVLGLLGFGIYAIIKVSTGKEKQAAPQRHPFDLQQEQKSDSLWAHLKEQKGEKAEEYHRVGNSACNTCGDFHAVATDSHSREKRLNQLDVLRGAGLYTDAEYKKAKARILHETER